MAGGSDAACTITGTTTATNLGPSKTATSLAPGFRFHPTDEELVRYYLTRKVRGKPFKLDAVAEVDIYKSEPWDLPGLSRLASRDLEWYFFGALDKKYGNGARMNRATGSGYWKATGNDRPVSHNSRVIGMKKTLVYHKGRAPDGKRTDWVMHEYRLSDQEFDKAGVHHDGYVLCKIFEKRGLGPPNGKQYAPFVEDDWDDNDNDDTSVFVPAASADEPDDQRNAPVVDLGPFQCKNEKQDDGLNLPTIYDPEPFLQNKRPRGDTPETQILDLNLGVSTSLSRENVTTQNPPPRRFDIATFDLSVHPSYLDLIEKLQKEIHNISIERETLKMEVMSAQAMITVLHSRLEFLHKEKHDLVARLPR